MAFDPNAVLRVEVVSADKMVWEGDAESVIVKTTEGDIGILVHHEPILAALVPCAAEILTKAGTREIIAIDGGFVSVDHNRVSLLSQYATLAEEISLEQARHEFEEAQRHLEKEGDTSEENMRHYRRAQAQLKAAEKAHIAG